MPRTLPLPLSVETYFGTGIFATFFILSFHLRLLISHVLASVFDGVTFEHVDVLDVLTTRWLSSLLPVEVGLCNDIVLEAEMLQD